MSTRQTYVISYPDGVLYAGGAFRFTDAAAAYAYIARHDFLAGATVAPEGVLLDKAAADAWDDRGVTMDDISAACAKYGSLVSGSVDGPYPAGDAVEIDQPCWPAGWRVTGGRDEPHVYSRKDDAIDEFRRRDAEWAEDRRTIEARRPKWEPTRGEDGARPPGGDPRLAALAEAAIAAAAVFDDYAAIHDAKPVTPENRRKARANREQARKLRAAVSKALGLKAPPSGPCADEAPA